MWRPSFVAEFCHLLSAVWFLLLLVVVSLICVNLLDASFFSWRKKGKASVISKSCPLRLVPSTSLKLRYTTSPGLEVTAGSQSESYFTAQSFFFSSQSSLQQLSKFIKYVAQHAECRLQFNIRLASFEERLGFLFSASSYTSKLQPESSQCSLRSSKRWQFCVSMFSIQCQLSFINSTCIIKIIVIISTFSLRLHFIVLCKSNFLHLSTSYVNCLSNSGTSIFLYLNIQHMLLLNILDAQDD